MENPLARQYAEFDAAHEVLGPKVWDGYWWLFADGAQREEAGLGRVMILPSRDEFERLEFIVRYHECRLEKATEAFENFRQLCFAGPPDRQALDRLKELQAVVGQRQRALAKAQNALAATDKAKARAQRQLDRQREAEERQNWSMRFEQSEFKNPQPKKPMRFSVEIKKPNGEMFAGAVGEVRDNTTREEAERLLHNWYPGVTLTYNASIRGFKGECPVIAQHNEEDLPLPSTEEALLPSSTDDVRRDASTLLNASAEEDLPVPTLNFDNPLKRREKKSAPAAPAPVVSAQGEEEDLPAPSLNNYFETRRREAVGSR